MRFLILFVVYFLANEEVGIMEIVILRFSKLTPSQINSHFRGVIGESLKMWIYNSLTELNHIYPRFDYWFNKKVFEKFKQNTGERDILFVFPRKEERNPHQLLGIAITKDTPLEKKICTFRVNNKFRNKGIGTRLMRACMKLLNTNNPMITVPRNMLQDESDSTNCYSNFEHFFKKKFAGQFILKQQLRDYYRPGFTEYVYNGFLPPKITIQISILFSSVFSSFSIVI